MKGIVLADSLAKRLYCSIRPLTTDQYPTKARRPAYSVLSKAKIERVFGIVPPEWEESLGKYMMEISGK